jgi:hypothetical protein
MPQEDSRIWRLWVIERMDAFMCITRCAHQVCKGTMNVISPTENNVNASFI